MTSRRATVGRGDAIVIRDERDGDARAIFAVHAAAFPTDAEARLVDALRASRKALVSLVAEADAAVIGHVLFSPVSVEGAVPPARTSGAGLAPLAVRPDLQRLGIGTCLVEAGLEACRRAGLGFAVVLGEPRYYRRFGFGRALGHRLYTCQMAGCGPASARSAWNQFNGLFAAADGDPRYLAGKIVKGAATAYVALMVGRARTQLDIVEIGGMQDKLVVASAASLGEGIDRDGRGSVYGIHFDTDRAHVKPDSKAALDEIAKLLRERGSLTLFIVGHTDAAGDRADNQALSEARARAVVPALVKDYGIAASRLEGYGVGPLAPVASNADAGGRAKNRRVELVAR